jgi:hypothetical protein
VVVKVFQKIETYGLNWVSAEPGRFLKSLGSMKIDRAAN